MLSMTGPRHCERSEAIQSSAGLPRRPRLLAMTATDDALELVRLLFDLPGLPLGNERLEVGGLALGGGGVLLADRGFEGRRRVLVDDAESDGEAFGQLDQHRGN